MTYRSVLPKVFPYTVRVPDDVARNIVAKLVLPGKTKSGGVAANGSSFAVTVDTETGWKILWLSATSLERINDEMPEWDITF